MEDVSRLIEKVSQELGPDASDEEITASVLKTIETLPDSERAEVLEHLVKGTSSRELAHLREESDEARNAGDNESEPDLSTTSSQAKPEHGHNGVPQQ
jgi:DNA-directed RNA polymerase specialized sigma24 family protein